MQGHHHASRASTTCMFWQPGSHNLALLGHGGLLENPGNGEVKEAFSLGKLPTTQVSWFFVYPASRQTSEGGSFGPPNGAQEEGLKRHRQACQQAMPSEASKALPPTIKHTIGKYSVVPALVRS